VGNVYIPVVVLGALAAGFVIFSVITGAVTGPRRYNRAKLDAYECGIEPTPQPAGGGRFPVRYYLTAMLFIIFDIEIIFLYPYAVLHQQLGAFGVWEMVVFAVAVFASFVYLIANGALDWGPAKRMRSVVDEGMVSATRTAGTTVRRVGLEGREPVEAA
jgi:NADH-quinone oxidoreductase subunit A